MEEDKSKPKATLIKQPKPEKKPETDTPAKKDGKKVVVVKKRVVVKKTPRVVSVKKTPSEEKETKEATKKVPDETSSSSGSSNSVKAPESSGSTENKTAETQTGGEKHFRAKSTGTRTGYNRTDRSDDRGGYNSNRTGGSQDGYNNNRTGNDRGGYNNNRTGGDRGGYNNNRTGGDRGGYNNNRTGGDRGGYNNNRTGGQQGGYNNNRAGGDRGGYNNRTGGQQGGYNNRTGGDRGGYNNNRPSGDRGGYNNNRPGGQQGGFNRTGGQSQGRFNNNRPGGAQQGGFNRGGGQSQGRFNNNRPGGPQQGGFNRGGQAQGGAPTSGFADGKKTNQKKFFKNKKGNKAYSQKKHQDSEKYYELKKKENVAPSNPVPKQIDIMEVITVSDLAKKMNLKSAELISKLMGMGMMVTINQQIDADTATIIADEYNCKVNIISLYDETIIESDKEHEQDLQTRPPIVTVMGHVDHGKTKLLDTIRKTDVVADEHGGITQHIGAYQVKTPQGIITFLDTPGHAAFTQMRVRGAEITDIVILVVAATEGVMPQTVEAINHAKDAKVPIIVAVNKMDLPDANPEKITQQLADYGIMPEAWGGHNQFINVSAMTGDGIDNLLSTILLEAEMLELKANFNCRAEGKVVETRVDQGRGIVSTVLVEKGNLKVGDAFVAGIYSGKVRAMFNDKGEKILEAGPSTPVEILGFTGTAHAGDPFQVTENEKIAKQFGGKRQELKKVEQAKNVKKITLDNLYENIQQGSVQELKVIIKGDVHGSVEALQHALEELSTPEIRLVCIHAAAGAIIDNDVSLASASNAIIIGFHVRPTPQALAEAEKEKVEIRKYNIIHDAVEDIEQAMEGMLAPEIRENVIGKVEVRELFKVPKIGFIAGCMVTEGRVTAKSYIHVIRDGIVVHSGKILSLRRFKDEAKDVLEGFECGISLVNYTDIKVGDIFEPYEREEIVRKLSDTKKKKKKKTDKDSEE